MQGNLLFVGCSHTNGFWGGRDKDGGDLHKQVGDTNNYAEIYANEIADEKCYAYSSAGASNNKYPRWIKTVTNSRHERESKIPIEFPTRTNHKQYTKQTHNNCDPSP